MAEATTEVQQDPVEILEPNAEVRIVTIGKEENETEMRFVQRPLSYFGKLDFFSVMGRALDRAMSGPDGVSIGDLLNTPENTSDLRDADTFVRGIAKVAGYAPDLFLDLYCVILAVPRGTREFTKQVMELPEEQGGLSDEDGIGILNTFVDQNWEVLMDFFTVQVAGLGKKISEKAAPPEEKEGKSARSKRSKSTPPSTPSPSAS